MRYDKESDKLIISVADMVAVSRRGISSSLPCDSDEPEHFRNSERDLTPLSLDFTAGEFSFTLVGSTTLLDGGILHRALTDTSVKRPRKEVTMQARGEAYLYAYMLAKKEGLERVSIICEYISESTGEDNRIYESATLSKLESFFNKCKLSIIIYAKPEIERVTVRLPSMKNIKFPYGKARDGQKDIARGVYGALSHGATLFVCAPTGTGKTVSVLFPAVRALGNEKCEKVFYFTPKSTTAMAAKDTVEDISAAGASIRAVIMHSKERLCKNGLVCRDRRGACKNSAQNKLADAVLALYN